MPRALVAWITSVVASVVLPRGVAADPLTGLDGERLYRALSAVDDAPPPLAPVDPDAWRDPVSAAILENTAAEYRGGHVGFALTAGVAGEVGNVGALHGSAEAAWDLPLCRVLGVHARGATTTHDDTSWALGGTGCIPIPWNTLQVSYTRRENVRASLLDRAILLTDRRTEHDLNLTIRAWRWRDPVHTFVLMPLTVDLSTTASSEGEPYGAETLALAVAPFEWRYVARGFGGEDATLRALAVRMTDQADAPSAGDHRTNVMIFSPVTVDGFRLARNVAFGGDLGIATGTVKDRSKYVGPGPYPEPEVFRMLAHVEGWLGVEAGTATAQLRYLRTLAPTFGGQLVLENRVTGRGSWHHDKVAARGEAFVGHATLVRSGPNEGAAIAGAGGELAYALWSRVHAVGRLESARALMPSTAMDAAIARWETRATLGLTAQLDGKR